MCLQNLTEFLPPRTQRGFGWKVFVKDNRSRLWPDCRYRRGGDSYHVRRWYDRVKAPLNTSDGQPYQAGFHVFRTRVGARDWHCPHADQVIRRVEWSGLVNQGRQCGYYCIVAERMRILPQRP